MEAVREGYLLHYRESRVLEGYDEDLALLAGDYLYALGLDRLAALGDTEAVAVLSELIARCAQLHAEGRDGEVEPAVGRRPAGGSRASLGERSGSRRIADLAEDVGDFGGRVGDLPVGEAEDPEAGGGVGLVAFRPSGPAGRACGDT